MIRVVEKRDDQDVPTKWHDIPTVDIERISPRLADAFDVECARVPEYGIRSFGEAQWKTVQLRRRYFEIIAENAGEGLNRDRAVEEAAGWLNSQKDSRDVALASLWAALAKHGSPVALQALYDGELDYIEVADPLPVPKQPQDRKPGKARAGSAHRPEPADA